MRSWDGREVASEHMPHVPHHPPPGGQLLHPPNLANKGNSISPKPTALPQAYPLSPSACIIFSTFSVNKKY